MSDLQKQLRPFLKAFCRDFVRHDPSEAEIETLEKLLLTDPFKAQLYMMGGLSKGSRVREGN